MNDGLTFLSINYAYSQTPDMLTPRKSDPRHIIHCKEVF